MGRRNEEVGLLDSWIDVVDGCICVLYEGLGDDDGSRCVVLADCV